ncbi:hypothetical protein [Nocardiopsis suaedae]|uniref:Secreted protein n=1 Tax=Nocardiopsis suaedae TaxID=3018444 RepID=A0ABT4TSV3_9ACTN|nr:hypothetical protein [Nocardiopsis suaedae]MDA2807501.1 hypothetical protein [Nocardiopsis suaedae]
MPSAKSLTATLLSALALTAAAVSPSWAEDTAPAPQKTHEAQAQTSDAEAANCSVSSPRVRYWCDTVRPATAYTNYSNAKKHYNEMYEGGSLPVGIYMESNGSKFHVVNGTGYVYKTVPDTSAWALCWNRSSSRTSSAHCDYVRTT